MKIANIYNHLNGYEYMLVHRKQLWEEIENAILAIDANDYIKYSKDKSKLGKPLYSQKKINKQFQRLLFPLGWSSVKTPYYVTGDIETAKAIASMRDKKEQQQIIERNGFEAYSTNNQVDFVKDRVAVEVQLGKYFSVAYDLHVKHTFFFLRDDIDVGIEIIPTRAMMLKMDKGVPWFENEVANVIREGRSNPTVPIVIIGIEPEEIFE
ncbi:MAG: hypothetical protein NC081_11465 [Roseburia sp.]|nr:hypothetical protein [Roseburia sp.]